jgi:predicted alpha/beta superfamily hydrolase
MILKMKKFVILCLYFLPLYSLCQKKDTLTIHSSELKETRKLVVYTPPEYDYFKDQNFEVVYVFDAQASQYIDMVSSTMRFQDCRIFPMIIVGVISTDRNKDFLPVNEYPETAAKYRDHLGNADKFMNYISNEAIPAVDSAYRTLPKRLAIGHSNGAAFIAHCLLEKADIFDGYIAISPNFGYDKLQFVKRFKNFDLNRLTSKKFFYMCNSSGYPEEGDWIPGRKQIAGILNQDIYKKKIISKNQEFPTENHSTVFQVGLINGIREYFNYQYFNAANLTAYYDELSKNKKINLTPKNTNQTAYNLHFAGKTAEAVKILLWANKLFPEDLNLYDSIGELYQTLNKKDDAKKFYLLMDKKIDQQKDTLTSERYEQLKKGAKKSLDSLR